jgi:ribosome recycling factor
MVKDLKKEKEITEDDAFKAQDEIQEITDGFVKKIDKMAEDKEKEILQF